MRIASILARLRSSLAPCCPDVSVTTQALYHTAITQPCDQDADRVESGKAAAAACAGGVFGALPLLLATAPGAIPAVLELASAAAASVLFGVTYRHCVRKEDVGDAHLRVRGVILWEKQGGLGRAVSRNRQ